MNVFTYGINDGYTYLAARRHDDPNRIVGAGTVLGAEVVVDVVNFGGDQGWRAVSQASPSPANPHFPFGLSVDPDR